MSFLEADADRTRALFRRRMAGASAEEIDAWVALEPRDWVGKHGQSLFEAGLSAQDAGALYERLGPETAKSLSRLLDQGRMADMDLRYVHLWAASGLLKPTVTPGTRPGRSGPVSFTRWITEARKYIKVCDGDQHVAALAAAAGLSVAETVRCREANELDVETLGIMAALQNSSTHVTE